MLWPFLSDVRTSERGSINSSANCNTAPSHAMHCGAMWHGVARQQATTTNNSTRRHS